MPKLESLRDLWVHEIKDLYSVEKQIVVALPKMAGAAGSEDLQHAFEEHLEQTRGHVERLEEIFQQLDLTPKAVKCKGIEGIIAEGKAIIDLDLPDPVGDAALIGAAKRVEHYEMAAYGTARAHAELLGETEAVRLLEQTLEEEKETDQRLTSLAEEINPEAERGEDERRDEADEDGATAGNGGSGNGASRRKRTVGGRT
jgi:ferritin-like metal-binding protein YciE